MYRYWVSNSPAFLAGLINLEMIDSIEQIHKVSGLRWCGIHLLLS